jgi:plasmid maintenance system antidote protein VapI
VLFNVYVEPNLNTYVELCNKNNEISNKKKKVCNKTVKIIDKRGTPNCRPLYKLLLKSMNKFSAGEILRAVCKELNLNNKQVADILSTTHQNVSRIFGAENVNTDTINRLTEGLGINIYAALARKWDEMAKEDPQIQFKEPRGEYFITTPKIQSSASSKPKISILIEINQDQQEDILKLLNLGKIAT